MIGFRFAHLKLVMVADVVGKHQRGCHRPKSSKVVPVTMVNEHACSEATSGPMPPISRSIATTKDSLVYYRKPLWLPRCRSSIQSCIGPSVRMGIAEYVSGDTRDMLERTSTHYEPMIPTHLKPVGIKHQARPFPKASNG